MVKQEKKMISRKRLLLLLTILIFSAPPVVIGSPQNTIHPDLTEQEMLMPCSDCHSETTPDLQKEWFNSIHGLAMVKCYQCHGTFETFKVTPEREDCAACHADMLKKCPADKPCWDCHVPHSFKTAK
ncbi:cytochrome c3 family protein [Desulfogranum japonicum]|uniref:cytochrome c3 family protein n=1 Tax=Desulfogranum japonicum TaxID=231447 RepID=UPI001E588453|nr:cytochrome c3 family protein [Desulfogranum japonicum]